VQLTFANKSILAAGILVAAAAVMVFKSPRAPAKAGEQPDSGRPQRSATVHGPRPSKPAVASAFPSDSSSESQNFLPALQALASSNPKKALANLAAIEDPDLLSLALAAVGSGWAQEDPLAAAKWVAGLPTEEQRGEAGAGLISVWAASAPTECFGWAAQHPPGHLREESLVKLADVWGSSDPQEALKGFLTLEVDGGSDRGLRAIVSRWVIDEPSVAVEQVSGLDKSPRRDDLLQAALVSLSSQDPELAWKYSDRVSDRKSIEHVRGVALKAMAETRPLDALKLAETAGNSEALLAGIARGWAVTDDDAAEEWIASLPDPDLAARLRVATSE
jgi:hypothetical protein